MWFFLSFLRSSVNPEAIPIISQLQHPKKKPHKNHIHTKTYAFNVGILRVTCLHISESIFPPLLRAFLCLSTIHSLHLHLSYGIEPRGGNACECVSAEQLIMTLARKCVIDVCESSQNAAFLCRVCASVM